MNGEQARNFRRFGITHVDWRHGSLPVMSVQKIRPPVGKFAGCNAGRRQRKRRKALPVVGIILARLVEIGPAGALVISGRIEDEEIQSLVPAFEQIGLFAQQVGEFVTFHRVRHGSFHRRVPGYKRARLDAIGFERDGERAGNIGEPSGLDQG